MRLRLGLLAFYGVLLLAVAANVAISELNKSKKAGPEKTAFGTSVFVVLLLHAGMAWIFRNDPLETLMLALIAATFGFGWFPLIFALIKITVSPFKTEHVPDDRAVVVTSKKRRKLISLEKSVDLDKEDTFEFQDLRVRLTNEKQECQTVDFCDVSFDATLQWHVRRDKTDVERFLSFAQEPELMLRREMISYLAMLIGQSKNSELHSRLRVLEERCQRHLTRYEAPMGISILSVSITKLVIRFPTLAEGGAPTVEAERLRQIDPAVRAASVQTLQHVQRLWEIQRGESKSATKEG